MILAQPLGAVNLLLLAALLLELAVLCARRLERSAAAAVPAPGAAETAASQAPSASGALGGAWLDGILLLRSPYLGGIALWVVLLSLGGSFLYFQQANIVAAASEDPAVRVRIFASIDLAIGILTLVVQCLATGRLISRIGVGPAAALLPVVFLLGFVALALSPTLVVVIVFQSLQRTANFAISNPAREILFTVVNRAEKYKAKNVIDIVIFRGADAVNGWLFAALRGLGLELGVISLTALPLMAVWAMLAIALGREEQRRAGPR